MIIKPSITLNGTSKETLIEDYSKAAEAIRDAQAAFLRIEFSPRDYLNGNFSEARSERYRIARNFQEILEYCNEHLEFLTEEK